MGEKQILEIFAQGLFPRSWGCARRPTRTGEGTQVKEELHQNGPEEVPESVETRVIRVGPVHFTSCPPAHHQSPPLPLQNS